MVKFSKKALSALLALLTMMCLLCAGVTAMAATPDSQTVEVYAGEKASIPFYVDAYGFDGDITISNPDLFTSLSVDESLTVGGGKVKVPTKKDVGTPFIISGAVKEEIGFTLVGNVVSDAKPGDKSVLTISYLRTDSKDGKQYVKGLTKTVTVKVIEKTTTTKTEPGEITTTTKTEPGDETTTTTKKDKTTTTKKDKTTTTKKPGTTTKKDKTTTVVNISTTTTKKGGSADKEDGTKAPTVPTKAPISPESPDTGDAYGLDFTELTRQINIAESLDKNLYTSDSWAVLESALAAAKAAYSATTQAEVNKAADALAKAIADLVKIDVNSLRDLLNTIKDFLKDTGLEDIWNELMGAMEQAEAALESGDQDAINAAYKRLEAAYKALKDKLAELGKENVVIQEVEVDGECHEKCHKPVHKLWLILFIISAILNVIFIVLLVLYILKRKKNAADATPLVDYDINDD